MPIYGGLLSREKPHTTREGSQERSPLQRTAIYPVLDRQGEDKRIHPPGVWGNSLFYRQNFSQVPLLKFDQPVPKELKKNKAFASFNQTGTAQPDTVQRVISVARKDNTQEQTNHGELYAMERARESIVIQRMDESGGRPITPRRPRQANRSVERGTYNEERLGSNQPLGERRSARINATAAPARYHPYARQPVWQGRRPGWYPHTWTTMLGAGQQNAASGISEYQCPHCNGWYPRKEALSPLTIGGIESHYQVHFGNTYDKPALKSKKDWIASLPVISLDHQENYREYIERTAAPRRDGTITPKAAQDAYNDTNNLEVMCTRCNSSKH